MKKSANKTNYMKGAAILLITMCLLPFGSTKAQTIQSAQYKLTTCQGINVVVRESATGTPVISFRKNESTYTSAGAHFVYGDLDANTAKEFVIPDTLLVLNNRIRYFVNDMRVVGDMCYFCGVREYVHGEVDPETGLMVIDSVGILGRFRLDPSGFGTSVNYNLKHIAETKALNRMDIYADNGDTAVAMIGVVSGHASESCLAVARVRWHSDPSPWAYKVEYTSTDTAEVFTDISINTRHTTVASYHRTGYGKDYFCLRAAKNEDVCTDDDYTGFNYRYKYTTNPFENCAYFVRPDYADVRLSAVPWAKKVYAAYTCSFDACTNMMNQTALCEINTSNMQLNNVQIVQKLYGTSHTLVDMKYLYKTDGDESGALVALLHLTGDLHKTVIEYPSALISNYVGAVPRALVQCLEKDQLRSVSAYNGNDVRFGGQWGSSTPTVLTYLQELLPSIGEESMCFQNSKADVMVIDKTQMPIRSLKVLHDATVGMVFFEWGAKTSVPTDVNADNTCIY